MNKWRKTYWGEIASLEYGKSLRGYQDKTSGFRVFGTNGAIGWHEECLCNSPGVIIGRKGAYRGVHFSPEPFYVIDTAFFLKPKNDFDIRWAYYCLQQYDINSMDSGSAIPSTSREDFYNLQLMLPPLSEQRRIASILGAFDDKIELNRRMNATLEGMAQALFKSWFIDFEPVHAKAAGLAPALPPHLASLFPAAFTDSPLGPIPEGWRVGTICELFDIIGGGTPKTTTPEYWEGTIPWFSVADIKDENLYVINTEKRITEEGLNNSSTNILPVGTTIITARGTVGKCCIAGLPMTMNQSCYALRASKGYNDHYIFFSVRNQVKNLQRSGHGSVFNTITRNTFKTIHVPVPPVELTQKWGLLTAPLFQHILDNTFQSQTLAALRDTLLPRLISGEL